MDQPLRERAEHLLERAEREADRALIEAIDLAADEGTDTETAAIAWRAAGIAARERGDLDIAGSHFDRSAATAIDARAPVALGRTLICRAGLAALTGDESAALADLAAAEALLDGPEAANVAVQRAAVTHQSGDLESATNLYGIALQAVRAHHLELEEARVLSNRGLLGIHRSTFAAARRDLEAAAVIYRRHDHPDMLLFVAHNLGYLAICEADLPAALSHFESARKAALAAGTDPIRPTSDRSEALLAAGLIVDAERESAACAEHYDKRGASAQAADAYLTAGQAALAARAPDRATDYFERALDLFSDDPRTAWRAVAASMMVAASVDAPGPTSIELQAEIDRAIAVLDEQSLRRHAAQARLIDIRLKLHSGHLDAATDRHLEVSPGRTRLPPDLQADYWLTTGHLATGRGDTTAALRAFGRSLDWNRRLRRSLPWIETATSPGPIGAAVADAGLRTVLARPKPRPANVLRWMEARYESTPVRPGSATAADTEMAQAQTEARAAAGEVDELLRHGSEPHQLHLAERRLRQAERRVTRLDRLPTAHRPRLDAKRTDIRALRTRLHSHDLLEIADLDGHLFAVTDQSGRLRLHSLGPAESTLADIALARTHLRRCWTTGTISPGLAAVMQRLDDRLVPDRIRWSERPLVVVHPPDIAALPFGALPSMTGRPVVIAPSLHQFVSTPLDPPARAANGPPLFVAGPDLPAASTEIHRSAGLYGSATVLEGDRATVERVVDHLHTATAHIACHGSIRHDSPMFSSLRLADGPLPVHALQRARLPRTVILSACDVGRPAKAGPDHVLGLPAALLTLGVDAVAASCLSVPDATTADVMVGVHKQLAAGTPLATALAEMRSAEDPLPRLVAATFSCHAVMSGA